MSHLNPSVTSDEQRALRLKQAADENQAAISQLEKAGVYVDSVHDLIKQKGNYARAIPTLLRLLPNMKTAGMKESIVRALGERDAMGLVEDVLIREFRAVPSDLFAGESLKWAIGNTLEILASDKYADELISLASEKSHGKARQMIVFGLGRLKVPKAVDVLISLLDDEDVCGHAVIALGRLKAVKAAPNLERLRGHPNRWIRTEVSKALKRMNAR